MSYEEDNEDIDYDAYEDEEYGQKDHHRSYNYDDDDYDYDDDSNDDDFYEMD
ncbi:highly acidic protein [Campylobacter estrildidarum]|uniref:Highly acidic protein n=1 Tax=Campylobacter estrildidarum TaxID=2510189 RepID=A0A4U7BG73_9BACT|nr:highly acidic protein [Campylobacter estrildidarum]TKX29141.1 highly acidic protein [Campylobacter estrildidarum]